MINNLNILLPEVFLSISIFSVLMIGVYFKNSYNLVNKLTLLILISCLLIIINSSNEINLAFSDSFKSNSFTNFIKVLIILSSIFVLNISQEFIKENKISKFEYPIIILISFWECF